MKIEEKNGQQIIRFEHNGMSCYYYMECLASPQSMKAIAEELESFCKFFFANEHVSWSEFMDDKDVYESWNYHFLQNEWIDEVEKLAEEANYRANHYDEEFDWKQIYRQAKINTQTPKETSVVGVSV